MKEFFKTSFDVQQIINEVKRLNVYLLKKF